MDTEIKIVLCRPEGGLNIGSVCRIMKNMTLSKLALVQPHPKIDENDVRMMAVHALDIYENAERYNCLEDALSETALSAGVTRRRGTKRKFFSLLPEEIASKAAEISGTTALVFGNEQNGLSDKELKCCDTAVHIPSNNNHPSLNLSHAVAVLSYSCYRALEDKVGRYAPVSRERILNVSKTIVEVLHHIGYFDKEDRFDVPQYLTDILGRAALSEREAAYMVKMFEKIRILKQK